MKLEYLVYMTLVLSIIGLILASISFNRTEKKRLNVISVAKDGSIVKPNVYLDELLMITDPYDKLSKTNVTELRKELSKYYDSDETHILVFKKNTNILFGSDAPAWTL